MGGIGTGGDVGNGDSFGLKKRGAVGSGDYFGEPVRRGGTGTGYVPLIYEARNYETQKKIGDVLESKYSYGFGSEEKDRNTIYFFNGEEILAQMYENGKIEISPFIDSKMLVSIEKIVGGNN